MSRLGKKPINLPEGVKVTMADHKVKVAGPKGTLESPFPPNIVIKTDETQKKVLVECPYRNTQDKALHGLTRSLINNMVIGVTRGYEKRLEIIGVGYNAKLQANELLIQIGYSHPIKMQIPQGISVAVPNPNLVTVQGMNKELVTQFAANLKRIKPCNSYTLKGIKYADETVKKKPGKTFVSGT